jgi:hypothetical protein
MANRRFLTQGFHMDIVVREIGSVKPMTSGEVEGNKYSAGVKLKTTTIEEVEDPELGLIDRETHIWIKIPCSSSKEAGLLNTHIRALKDKKEPIRLNVSLPRKGDTDTYACTSIIEASDLLNPQQDPKKEVNKK